MYVNQGRIIAEDGRILLSDLRDGRYRKMFLRNLSLFSRLLIVLRGSGIDFQMCLS